MYNVYKPYSGQTTEVVLIASCESLDEALRIADEKAAISIEQEQETISVVVWKQPE